MKNEIHDCTLHAAGAFSAGDVSPRATLAEDRLLRHQGEPIGVLYDRYCQINIQVGPMEVTGRGPLDIEDLADRSLFEPGELLARHEQLPVLRQEPYPGRGYVGNLNRGAFPKRP